MSGKLYGVGVGPGDPKLMTYLAVETIQNCPVIAVPADGKEHAISYKIASGIVKDMDQKECLGLSSPMTKDRKILEKNYQKVSEEIIKKLDEGKNVAYLTLGDPTVYSTCMYVEQMIEQQGYPVETVSGIPSFCAAAARLNQPLGEQEDQIHILPGSYEAGEGLQLSGTKILMKTGKKMGQIKEFLQGSSKDICLVENCGMDDERIVRSVEEISEDAGYYSLLIVKDRKR